MKQQIKWWIVKFILGMTIILFVIKCNGQITNNGNVICNAEFIAIEQSPIHKDSLGGWRFNRKKHLLNHIIASYLHNFNN